MFVDAIEIVGGFTRPIFTIGRKYGSSKVTPGAGTMFFVNDQGWALTTRSIAQVILKATEIDRRYADFCKEKNAILRAENFEDELKVLETKYNYTDKSIAQMKVSFFDCVDKFTGFECKLHNKYDIAAIKMDGWEKVLYKGHAVFAGQGDEIKPGKSVCRIGYPFPEFTNFAYDVEKDDICWTNEGKKVSPRFPMNGMVTRLLSDGTALAGIEVGTVGPMGLNGSPLFDKNGTIYGMQVGLNKLKLCQCIHVDIIKDFLTKENIPFFEGPKRESDKKGKFELLHAGSISAKMS